MQYAWGGNVGMQMIKEVADNIAGHRGVIINTAHGRDVGRSPTATQIEIATPTAQACGAAPCCARASGPTRC